MTASGHALRVAVGSSNPSKIRAVEAALQQIVHGVDIAIEGFAVESGVADQPFGDEETQAGAKHRSKSAYTAYRTRHGRSPHFSIGLEGGLEWIDQQDAKQLYCMAWMAVYGRRTGFVVDLFASSDTETYAGDRKPIFGLAKTASFAMPPAITELIEKGMELGDADDQIFGRVKSKHGSGTVGILTNGLIDRSAYYEHALLLALVPWLRPELYPEGIDK